MCTIEFLSPSQYQQRNLALFQEHKARIADVLPHARIEHIGASSIPGAYSKGDLDIFVGVPARKMDSSIHVIARLGFQVKKDTLRTSELCMLFLDGEGVDVAIQLVANGSQFESFLVFRDALTESPGLLASYNELKLACTGMDQDSYRDRKSPFIEDVLNGH